MKTTIQAPTSWIVLTLVAMLGAGAFLYDSVPSFSSDRSASQGQVLNARLTPPDLLW